MDNELQETSLRDDLSAAFDTVDAPVITEEKQPEVTQVETEKKEEVKAEKLRDETGKFKAKEEQPVIEQAVEIPQAKPSPKSLKKELADKHWANLDPELQDALLQRDDDFAKGIEGYKTKAERADAFERVVSPYMATINSLGMQPDQAIGELLKTDYTLRHGSEQQKLAMVTGIFNAYGINPQQVFDYLQNGTPQINPEIAPVYQELQALKQQQEQLLRAQQQREQETLNSEIERAKQGKDHFDLVREDMAALLQANRAKDLDEAYEMAIWARPDLRATLLQQEREKAEQSVAQKEQAKRSQAAASSVRGSSPAVSTAPKQSLRDEIASHF
jgi:hypothetical protein